MKNPALCGGIFVLKSVLYRLFSIIKVHNNVYMKQFFPLTIHYRDVIIDFGTLTCASVDQDHIKQFLDFWSERPASDSMIIPADFSRTIRTLQNTSQNVRITVYRPETLTFNPDGSRRMSLTNLG